MAFFNNLSILFSRDKKPQKNTKTTLINQKAAVSSKQGGSQNTPSNQSLVPPSTKNQQAKPSQENKRQQAGQVSFSPQEIEKEKQALLREAKAQAREIVVEAKDLALQIKADSEKIAREQEKDFLQREKILDSKIDKLDHRLDQLQAQENSLSQERESVNQLKKKVEETKQKMIQRLEEISGMTQQEAQEALLEGLEKQLTQQMAKLIREKEEQAKLEINEKAQELLIDAMRSGATDYVAEYTVSVVQIPSEDAKGKIIGKSGRNIHAFEHLTGVDLDLDYSDSEVRLSCYDPVRREIARISLERLIKDGRIQPVRIEQVVKKVKSEIDKIMLEAGKDLCQRVGVYNLPQGLIMTLGRYKYRFSYGQNLIKHTLEVTKIGTKIAQELGLDVNVVKLGCLLHDIGKVADNPDENHVEAGIKIAKKYSMPPEVIACISQHHEDEEFTSPEAMATYIADAISGARPGARYENIEEYFERLENLEQIATSYSEVAEAYAVKAGREVRVLLNPEKSKDDDVTVLANKIKQKIEDKLTYPGSVSICVIREQRHTATAN